MAKIGTMVGQKELVLSEDEINRIISFVEPAVKKAFPNKEYKISVNRGLTEMVFLKVEGLFDTDKSFRMPNKDLVSPQYISLGICKHLCYDEAEEGKCYEWESMGKGKDYKPELKYTDYSISCRVIGHERRYRCKHIEMWTELSGMRSVRTSVYTYGTEISDMREDVQNAISAAGWLAERLKPESKNPFKNVTDVTVKR